MPRYIPIYGPLPAILTARGTRRPSRKSRAISVISRGPEMAAVVSESTQERNNRRIARPLLNIRNRCGGRRSRYSQRARQMGIRVRSVPRSLPAPGANNLGIARATHIRLLRRPRRPLSAPAAPPQPPTQPLTHAKTVGRKSISVAQPDVAERDLKHGEQIAHRVTKRELGRRPWAANNPRPNSANQGEFPFHRHRFRVKAGPSQNTARPHMHQKWKLR